MKLEMEGDLKDYFIGKMDKEVWERMLKDMELKKLATKDNENLDK